MLLRYGRGDVRFIAWLDGSAAAALAATGIIATVVAGRLGGLVLTALALAPGWVSRRAFQIVRSPDPTLTLGPRGMELVHPLLADALTIPAADVHSWWMGPFEQPPKSFWLSYMRGQGFPGAGVVDVSDLPGPEDGRDRLVVAFSRTLPLRRSFRLPMAVLWLQNAWQPLMSRRPVNGLVARVKEPDAARALIESSDLSRPRMPADVRAWLS